MKFYVIFYHRLFCTVSIYYFRNVFQTVYFTPKCEISEKENSSYAVPIYHTKTGLTVFKFFLVSTITKVSVDNYTDVGSVSWKLKCPIFTYSSNSDRKFSHRSKYLEVCFVIFGDKLCKFINVIIKINIKMQNKFTI